MKKILFTALFIAAYITTAEAQKAGKETITEVNVAAPTFSFIYEATDDSGAALGAVELQIYDRKLQTDGFQIRRLYDQVKGLDPLRPKVKLIHLPEVGGLAYKLAESLEELRRAEDGTSVLLVDYMALLEARRTKYN